MDISGDIHSLVICIGEIEGDILNFFNSVDNKVGVLLTGTSKEIEFILQIEWLIDRFLNRQPWLANYHD